MAKPWPKPRKNPTQILLQPLAVLTCFADVVTGNKTRPREYVIVPSNEPRVVHYFLLEKMRGTYIEFQLYQRWHTEVTLTGVDPDTHEPDKVMLRSEPITTGTTYRFDEFIHPRHDTDMRQFLAAIPGLKPRKLSQKKN